ncbi:uncharacterized protein A1O9_08878 [Exophiala aquamarina CBS 119918]|uniref:Ig-like domain-containing protein n=1 Tax=Exophiala aquamarina CBS 119918 TaxID=1182545 RepID=A0A072P544_9EURO|nr:uncharacterized protein A1O9_08878 [Exophiala aquamarina CBS 119918]KEF55224.1 hypothetical protein A1O9_08878 [Exophiala aquamarina CBS 119918]
MAPLRSTLFAASIALLALFQPIQAQNSTNSTGDGGDPVLDAFFIQDSNVGGPASTRSNWLVVLMECVGSNIDTGLCGNHLWIVTYGPRTWVYDDSNGNIALTAKCSLAQSTSSVVCSMTLAAPKEVFTNTNADVSALITATGVPLSSKVVTATVRPTDMVSLSVTITGGQEILAAAATATPAGSSGTKISPLFSGFIASFLSPTMMLL